MKHPCPSCQCADEPADVPLAPGPKLCSRGCDLCGGFCVRTSAHVSHTCKYHLQISARVQPMGARNGGA